MSRKRVLIVSPHFPPVNAPDMQRVRMSLPFFETYGWDAHVLAVQPDSSQVVEPLLNETVPAQIPVTRVSALPLALSRPIGIGNVALRALPALYHSGRRLIEDQQSDLVYFSTTMVLAMPLGRIWKQRLGTPYVLDIQDPWVSDYYDRHPQAQTPAKYGLARRIHARLEPWTMAQVDGLVSVSPDYIDELSTRYPRLRTVPSASIPFGASGADFELLERAPQTNRVFSGSDGRVHGVYAGRGGDDLRTAAEIFFSALRRGLNDSPRLFERVQVHCVGTTYATGEQARRTIAPIAERMGVTAQVSEEPLRVPYFEALQLLKDAQFLFVLGSDDPAYTASKIYPYILARKPLLAVVHKNSTLVNVLRETKAGTVVTFGSGGADTEREHAVTQLTTAWTKLLERNGEANGTDWSAFEQYSAREMTRRQCELFDQVVAHGKRAAA